MSDHDALDERLRAVERALTDADDLTDLRETADLARELERLSARLDDAEDCLDELDAATQALRGYVGNVRAVNRSVERTADAALAKAEALESADGDFENREVTPARSCEYTPCTCAARRPGESRMTDGPSATAKTGTTDEPRATDGDSGGERLLARIVESLAGLLRRPDGSDPEGR